MAENNTKNKSDRQDMKRKRKFGNKAQKNKRKAEQKKSLFDGECSDLKGHVFETFMESRDTTQYDKTLKALQVYVADKFRTGKVYRE